MDLFIQSLVNFFFRWVKMYISPENTLHKRFN